MTAKKEPKSTEASPPSNTRIWDELWNTDPKHTKPFTRPGGFKGTATKPIWMDYRMTEHFGPCGIGWGTEKPEYQVHQLGQDIGVFCTVALWYIENGVRGSVFGVGGDKVVNNGKMDDEAFKKAFTDAVSNAMKFIGVCADIHMGMFEDSKYVAQMREEFADEKQAPTDRPPPQTLPPPALPDVDESTVIRLTQAFDGAKTLEDIEGIWNRCKVERDALKAKNPAWFDEVAKSAGARKKKLNEQKDS
jgi:hypothetical protein